VRLGSQPALVYLSFLLAQVPLEPPAFLGFQPAQCLLLAQHFPVLQLTPGVLQDQLDQPVLEHLPDQRLQYHPADLVCHLVLVDQGFQGYQKCLDSLMNRVVLRPPEVLAIQ